MCIRKPNNHFQEANHRHNMFFGVFVYQFLDYLFYFYILIHLTNQIWVSWDFLVVKSYNLEMNTFSVINNESKILHISSIKIGISFENLFNSFLNSTINTLFAVYRVQVQTFVFRFRCVCGEFGNSPNTVMAELRSNWNCHCQNRTAEPREISLYTILWTIET